MIHRIGGYLPSRGNLNITPFQISGTVQAMGSANVSDQYIIPDRTPILDQASLQSCVAHSVSEAFSILKFLETGQVELYSRLYLYFNARAAIKATNRDNGCFLHDALASLTTLGICLEELYPYDISQVFMEPNILAYKEGNDNILSNYFQITSNNNQRLIDIEGAIRANHPVLFGTQVGPEFEQYRGDDEVFNPPATSLGGHAMVIVGIRTNETGQKEFLSKNSWSNAWGINGYVWLSSNYMTWSETNDIFVATRMPNLMV